MANEFLKSLISLLASSGGSASLPLSDLTQLGVELSLSDLGSDSCTLRLRLGPKIYYVPEKQPNPKGTTAPSEEAPWPTTPTPATPAPATEPSLSTLDAEITAVNSLTNRAQRPPHPPRLPRYIPPEELPPSLPLARESSRTESQRQELLTEPSSLPPQRRVIQKSDSDLLRTEQRQSQRKETAQELRRQKERRAGREYPWETRNSPPIKLQ